MTRWVMDMEKWVEWQRRLAPEAIKLTQERYKLLRELRHESFKGRRVLAQRLGITERAARQHIDFLRSAGLVESGSSGVILTHDGEQAIQHLSSYLRKMSGLTTLEEELSELLHLSEVVVVPGDSDYEEDVLYELGRAGAELLNQQIRPDTVIAVGGGTTLSQVAKNIHHYVPHTVVVPVRGGLGEKVEVQANTVASVLAAGLNGQYRMLHMPDGLTKEAVELLLQASPDIQEILKLIQQADILVQGIGRADEMAERRRMNANLIDKVESSGAIGEAMGYYFDAHGKSVYETGSLGMTLADLEKIRFVVAVAGGSRKGAAILSVMKSSGQDALVTDEGAAREILKLVKN